MELKVGQQVIVLGFGGEIATIEKTSTYWLGRVWDKNDERCIEFDLATGKNKETDVMPVVVPYSPAMAGAVKMITNAFDEVTA